MHDGSDQTEKPRYHHGDLRAALLVAGEAELEAAGIEGFSLRQVARRAGVSHAAPAHHFGDATGLLSALAAEGFRLFLAAQAESEALAPPEPRAQVVAAGLGYIAFARAHPPLFRLMFSSKRPDYSDPDLGAWAYRAYMHLVEQVSAVLGRSALERPEDCDMLNGLWAIAHGLADLIAAGRMKEFDGLAEDDRRRRLGAIIGRMLPDPA